MGRPSNDDLLARIIALRKAGRTWQSVGKELGSSENQVRMLYRYHRDKGKEEAGDVPDAVGFTEENVSENEKTVSYAGRITTVDELLEFAKVDLEVWAVDHFTINKWEGYRKNLSKDLTWRDGAIQDGFVKDLGGLFIAPLIQVKVWLIRKSPVPLEPSVHFVHFTPHDVPRKDRTDRGDPALKMAMVGLECHMGFFRKGDKIEPLHDRGAMSIFLQVAREYMVNKVLINGDLLDFPDLTDKYRREPGFEQQMQPALDEAAQYLADLRFAVGTGCEIKYIPGNHEERIKKMLIDHLPQVYHLRNRKMNTSLWSLNNLLGLDELDIRVADDYPDGVAWINDNLRVIHGVGLSAPRIVDSFDVSTIFGHIHRYEADSRTSYTRQGPRIITAMSTGFMGRVDGIIPGTKKNQNWCQSFAVVYYNDKDFTIVNIPIRDGRCIFDNLLWKAE